VWRALYWTGIPLQGVLLTAAPIREAGAATLGAALAILALLVPAGVYARRRFRDRREGAAFTLSVYWGNLGWLGLPASAAVFGTDALPAAVLYMAVAAAPQHFLVGPTLAAHAAGSGGPSGPRGWARAAARNHYLPVTVLGVAYAAAGLPAPGPLLDAAEAVVIAQAAPAFFAFGIVMVRAARRVDRDLFAAVGGRMVLGPAALVPVAALVEVPQAFWLQAAAASGMTPLALAAQHGLPRERLAAAVLWSTVLFAGLAVTLVLAGA
jgi:predicted permease